MSTGPQSTQQFKNQCRQGTLQPSRGPSLPGFTQIKKQGEDAAKKRRIFPMKHERDNIALERPFLPSPLTEQFIHTYMMQPHKRPMLLQPAFVFVVLFLSRINVNASVVGASTPEVSQANTFQRTITISHSSILFSTAGPVDVICQKWQPACFVIRHSGRRHLAAYNAHPVKGITPVTSVQNRFPSSAKFLDSNYFSCARESYASYPWAGKGQGCILSSSARQHDQGLSHLALVYSS